ncbi:MAG: putative membrane protein YedE/YeeE [Myxococcota bacterium]|jgi:uncharacterized membrane protein YedE/YeeE
MRRFTSLAVVFAAGVLFAAGLGVGGMTDPTKVIGFLTLNADWDPSLAFVMGGAIVAHVATYKLVLRQPSPLFAERFQIPTRRDLTPRLVLGAVLFGMGWALAGYCPGPALVSLPALEGGSAVFVAAMLAGMGLHKLAEEHLFRSEAEVVTALDAIRTRALKG